MGAHPPQLIFQETGSRVIPRRLKGVGADQLREAIGMVSGRHRLRPHLVESDGNAPVGKLERALGPCKAASDDRHHFIRHIDPFNL